MTATRRQILAGAVAMPAALALPGDLVGAPEEPLLALAERRERAMAACYGHGFDDEAVDQAADAVAAIDAEIVATPAATPAGLLAKLRMLAERSEADRVLFEDSIADMIASIAEDAEQLLGG